MDARGKIPSLPAAAAGLVVLALAAVLGLNDGKDFSLWSAIRVTAVAAWASVPAGWFGVRALVPRARGSTFWGLALTTGCASSALLGYLLGALGRNEWHAPILWLLFLAWLWSLHRQGSAGFIRPTFGAMIALAAMFSFLCGAAPVVDLMYLRADGSWLDWSYIDTGFHIARAGVLSQGAPAKVHADAAGLAPLVYPDLHLFWIGRLSQWAGTGVRSTLLLYEPILRLFARALLCYATGRLFGRSRAAGAAGVLFGFVFLFPSPIGGNWLYDADFAQQDPRFHAIPLIPFRSPSYGFGWELISASMLLIAMAARMRSGRAAMAAMMLAAFLLGELVRVRAQFLPPVAVAFAVLLCGMAWARRRPVFILAGLPAAVVVGLLYLEVHFGPYMTQTVEMGVGYGVFGGWLANQLPGALAEVVTALPQPLVPLGAVVARALFADSGFFTSLLAGAGIVMAFRRRDPSAMACAVFGVVLVISAIAASSLIVLNEYRDGHGDFGSQCLRVIHPACRVLALLCLAPLLRRAPLSTPRAFPWVVMGLLVSAIYSQKSATLLRESEPNRVYRMSADARSALRYVRISTPRLSVVATNPDRRVNDWGETVSTTNLLSLQTERPAYLQRRIPFRGEELTRREALLETVFNSTSPEEVARLLRESGIDYLVEFPERRAAIDLETVAQCVRRGEVRVFRVER